MGHQVYTAACMCHGQSERAGGCFLYFVNWLWTMLSLCRLCLRFAEPKREILRISLFFHLISHPRVFPLRGIDISYGRYMCARRCELKFRLWEMYWCRTPTNRLLKSWVYIRRTSDIEETLHVYRLFLFFKAKLERRLFLFEGIQDKGQFVRYVYSLRDVHWHVCFFLYIINVARDCNLKRTRNRMHKVYVENLHPREFGFANVIAS